MQPRKTLPVATVLLLAWAVACRRRPGVAPLWIATLVSAGSMAAWTATQWSALTAYFGPVIQTFGAALTVLAFVAGDLSLTSFVAFLLLAFLIGMVLSTRRWPWRNSPSTATSALVISQRIP